MNFSSRSPMYAMTEFSPPALNSSFNNFSFSATMTLGSAKVAYYVIGSFGVLLNSFVAGVFIAFGNLWTTHGTIASSNFHIFSQACVDNMVALLLILNTAIEDDGRTKFIGGNFFHELLCRLWYSKVIQVVALYVSICSILTLNFERYLAVVHPIFHKAKFVQTRKYSLCIFAISVVVGFAYELPYGVLTSGISDKGNCQPFSINMSAALKQSVGLLSISFEYIIPMSAIVFLYTSMAFKLHQKIEPQDKDSIADANLDMTRARNNVLKTSLLLTALFVLCWSPYQFCRILYCFGNISLISMAALFNAAVFMVYFNSCLNPFVYFLKYKPFQGYLGQFLAKLKSLVANARNIFR